MLYIFQKKKSGGKKYPFVYGWLYGFGYFFTNLYWITISLTFDENFNFLIPLALILIPSFLALFYGLATYCFFLIQIKKPFSNLFLFSLLLKVHEEDVDSSIFQRHSLHLESPQFGLEYFQCTSLSKRILLFLLN